MNKTIPFKKDHLDLLELPEFIEEEHKVLGQRGDAYSALENEKTALTMIRDSQIVCVFGYVYLRKGICEVIVIHSVHIKKNLFGFSKMIKKQLEGLLEVGDFNRIQMTTRDLPYFNRFAEFLGFKREGVLRNYIGSVDYTMWSVIKDG